LLTLAPKYAVAAMAEVLECSLQREVYTQLGPMQKVTLLRRSARLSTLQRFLTAKCSPCGMGFSGRARNDVATK